MKNLFITIAFLLLVNLGFAQAPPEGINYQAVALDPNGKEIVGVDSRGQSLPDKAISIRFTIISESVSGTEQYMETHKTNTDAYGMFSLVIGAGEKTGGAVNSFADINWGSGAHFLKVELDPDGGNNFVTMGIQQMMSVPYALYAKTSGTGGGTQGPKGDDGLSAYETWIALGNTGTQADFIASLSGPAGTAGPQGPQGPQGVAGTNGVDGAQGPAGPQGAQGAGLNIVGSVVDSSTLSPTYTGSIGDGFITQNTGNLWIWDGTQWNNVGNIVGPAGAQGESAYQVWISLGNTGTPTDFINALTGPAGAQGPQGPQGIQGAQGADGPQGPAGAQGNAGAAGAQGAQGIQGIQGPAGNNGIGISWLGTLAAAPSSPTLNQAYYNSTLGSSFIWNGTSWQTLAQDGTGGAGGGSLDDAYNDGGAGAGRTINANSGSVQINTTGTSTAGLEITTAVNNSSGLFATHNGNGVGVRVSSTSASNTYSAIQSITNASDPNVAAIIGSNDGGGYGVAAQLPSTASGFAAVFGNNLRTNGGSGVDGGGFQGVSGQTFETGGSGVFGLHNNPGVGADPNAGVVNAGMTALGFYGALGQTEYRAGSGVFGLNVDAIGSLADDATGVTGNGGFVGVLGTSGDAAGYGVASLTNIISLGDLEALGVKTFTIDHPQDPANKTLRHAAIESNEVLNVYRGNVICDSSGHATVELPAYFESINTNFSYILTPVGQSAPDLHIATEVSGNKFIIAGGKANMKVSWQVSAQRNDVYMQQHPFASENLKPARKSGYYLYPKGYGQSAEKKYFKTPLLDKTIVLKGAAEKQKQLKLQK
jgi:hypothetical protein